MRRIKRHTIYDAMEAAGIFDANPANLFSVRPDGSQLYEGPVPFPCVVYAPVEDIIVNGSWEDTPRGPKFLNEQKAIRHKVVNSKQAFEEAISSGWFDHPAKALKAIIEKNRAEGIEDTRTVPVISVQETISSYEKQIEELEAKLAKAEELHAISPPIPSVVEAPFSIKTRSKAS